ncbi:MAG: tRNA (guanosine(37)-N1)-methyltransferase TrmD [Deltaproteobacteria bacterium HGW-Deltaproteobacteria-4]|nr:MAG: tRNA (guanosine(37)-N1)-methyltransferase TrmD [Deltaproteobacteria bacterium HGW-Deltaproteobacteria-4]
MRFDLLTLFPSMVESPFAMSILGKAVERGIIDIRAWYLRDWAEGRHKVTDDIPYGGGNGMVLKPEPVARALQKLKEETPQSKVLLMSPQGQRFDQQEAAKLSQETGLIFVCGRYEGFDERIRSMVDAEYSIGDFVLTGGELPAMVMIDAIARLIPGVLGNCNSAVTDSFADGLLEHPHYTRPQEFNGMKVPEALLSGDHARIARWRRTEQLRRTWLRRPELLESAELSAEDKKFLADMVQEKESSSPC